MRPPGRGTAFAAVLVFLLFGFALSQNALRLFTQWSSISPWLAACGIAWGVGSAGMIVGGLWLAGSLGRHRIPLAVGGAGAALAGSVLVVGVLTYVVPCSSPG
jgi:hypothetical protein